MIDRIGRVFGEIAEVIGLGVLGRVIGAELLNSGFQCAAKCGVTCACISQFCFAATGRNLYGRKQGALAADW